MRPPEGQERHVVTFNPAQSDQPAVLCPRCQLPMMRGALKPIMFTNGLSEVVYACEACKTETMRTVKGDGSLHAAGIAGESA